MEGGFIEFKSRAVTFFPFSGEGEKQLNIFLPQYQTDSWIVKIKTIWNLSKVPHTNFVPNFYGGR